MMWVVEASTTSRSASATGGITPHDHARRLMRNDRVPRRRGRARPHTVYVRRRHAHPPSHESRRQRRSSRSGHRPAASLITPRRRTVQPLCSVGAGEQFGADAAAASTAMAFWAVGCAEWWTVMATSVWSDDPVGEDRPRSGATIQQLYARPLPPTRRARQWRRRARQNARLDSICTM
jgi:hypothetical protein